MCVIEGSLEVKLPTFRKMQPAQCEESEERESQKKEDPSARNVRKVAKFYVFQWFVCPDGPKGRLAKAAGAEPFGGKVARKQRAA